MKTKEQAEFEIDFCEKCMQITNHLDGECQKCKVDSICIKWGRKKARTDKRNWKNIVERFE